MIHFQYPIGSKVVVQFPNYNSFTDQTTTVDRVMFVRGHTARKSTCPVTDEEIDTLVYFVADSMWNQDHLASVEPHQILGLDSQVNGPGFTKGPLAVETVTGDEPVDVCLAYDIPDTGTPLVIAYCIGSGEEGFPGPEQAKANARLFSAAPELYSGLKDALAVLKDLKAAGPMLARFEKALRKVEGES